MDALDGLKALDAVVDALQHELKELHDERNVPPVERVSLAPLQWAIDKLADDLHTMETEVRDLRLAEAAARREVAELTKKASDLGVQQLTPRQVDISDSTGTDGEGQS
jgi:chromosome segregation ATPase